MTQVAVRRAAVVTDSRQRHRVLAGCARTDYVHDNEGGPALTGVTEEQDKIVRERAIGAGIAPDALDAHFQRGTLHVEASRSPTWISAPLLGRAS